MVVLNPKCIRIFLLVSYSVLIVAGIVSIVMGIYTLARKPDKMAEVDEEKESQANQTSVSSIITGLMDLTIGIVGLVGALLKKRILLMVNAGALSLALIGNLIMVIVTIIAYSSESNERYTKLSEKITKEYGNNTEYPQASLDIDHHQRKEGCCGWSGKGGENLFLKSPWYRENNKNGEEGRTLPDSCCMKRDEKCYNAKDVDAARKNGFVFPQDCFEQMDSKAKSITVYMVINLSFLGLLQAFCVMATILMIQELGEES